VELILFGLKIEIEKHQYCMLYYILHILYCGRLIEFSVDKLDLIFAHVCVRCNDVVLCRLGI